MQVQHKEDLRLSKLFDFSSYGFTLNKNKKLENNAQTGGKNSYIKQSIPNGRQPIIIFFHYAIRNAFFFLRVLPKSPLQLDPPFLSSSKRSNEYEYQIFLFPSAFSSPGNSESIVRARFLQRNCGVDMFRIQSYRAVDPLVKFRLHQLAKDVSSGSKLKP